MRPFILFVKMSRDKVVFVLVVFIQYDNALCQDPCVIVKSFLPSRWRHPHTLSWRSPGLFGWWVRPSFLLPPRHLSVHPDPDTSSSCPFWQTLELVPIACQYSHMHTQTHRPTLMRIPYYRINATPQRSSSSSTNLCFVKYTNDSINLDLI